MCALSSNTGHWTLQLRPVLPEEAAMTAYETFQPVLARAEQMLALEMPDAPLPMVLADEQRLQQILAILLDNAHTYASPGNAVALRVDFLRQNRSKLQCPMPGVAVCQN